MSRYLGIVGLMMGLVIPPSACEAPAPSTRLANALGSEQRLVAEPADGSRVVAEPEALEIYRDLSVFEWYQRGEPLMFNGRGYLPEGRPRAIAAERMHPAGAYAGVDFYVQDGDEPPYTTVYVPVYQGYWQPFVTEATDPPRAE